ncbi:MAG: hypothetical protein KAU31_08535 [Spirochaetaceae bacterium]|nr:hypothetical protein [Spirochaetaceae bacterium]
MFSSKVSRFRSRSIGRALLVVTLLFAVGAVGFSQESTGWWGSYYMPGNTAFSADVGLGFNNGLALDLSPGAEVIVAKFRPGDLFAIDLGVGAKGLVSFWRSSAAQTHGYLAFGGGPFVGAHFGFRGLDFSFSEYLERLDVFTAIGLNYLVYGPTGNWTGFTQPSSGLKFATYGGFNYFLTDNIAVSLSGSYWQDWSSTTVGVMLKLGPKEELGERADFGVLDDVRLTAESFGGDMAYLQFSALYWAILGFGGYVADDESFAEGDGIRWWMSFPDDNDTDEIEYTRALLRINSDGSKWWRAEFESEGDLSEFEYLVDKSGGLVMLRYEDPETNEVVSYEPSDPDAWWGGYSASVKDREDLDALSEGTERVRVPAGTFTADKVVAGEPPYQYMWWYTDEVPGLLVKLEVHEDDILIVEGELRDVLSGVTTPWDEPW